MDRHPQLLDHRPHRPRQVDAGRPHPRADRHRRRRKMRAQVLDSMDLERERGITIKAQAVRVAYKARDGETYQLHLIDTPGHVDFTYEVSRSLAACEGALLVVDAAQGVEAQTVANTYLAIDAGLELVPVLNKIDLPSAEPERVAHEIGELLGRRARRGPADLGQDGRGGRGRAGGDRRADPAAGGRPGGAAARADLRLRVRPVPRRGRLRAGRRRQLRQAARRSARCRPAPRPRSTRSGSSRPTWCRPSAWRPARSATSSPGIKDVAKLRVGDTLTAQGDARRPSRCPATARCRPVVFCGLFPIDTDRYADLRDALDKLALNDAALSLRARDLAGARLRLSLRLPRPAAHGHRARAARARVRPRAARDDARTSSTRSALRGGEERRGPQPDRDARPERHRGGRGALHPRHHHHARPTTSAPIMELCQDRRGAHVDMHYLSPERVQLRYDLPLAEIVLDFYDQLKSRSRGYASLDYELLGNRASDLVKLDILLAGDRGRRAVAGRPPRQGLRRPARRWSSGSRRRSRASSSRSRSRRRSARASSPARPSSRCART